MTRAIRLSYRKGRTQRPVLWWLRQRPVDSDFMRGMALVIEAWKHPISRGIAP